MALLAPIVNASVTIAADAGNIPRREMVLVVRARQAAAVS
jgi:hypothetical protein